MRELIDILEIIKSRGLLLFLCLKGEREKIVLLILVKVGVKKGYSIEVIVNGRI